MKKIYLLLTATFLLCLPCNKIMAQAPYKASVGGMYPFALGVSFKTFFTENVALQTDILGKVVITGNIGKNNYFKYFFPVAELNMNIMYQKKIKDKKTFELFWLMGGGVGLGCELFGLNGKFGANIILGLEFVFKNAPIAFQIDLRPGYGMLFNSGNTLNTHWFISDKNPWSHFDWLIGIALRYTFKKKTSEQ